MQDSRTNNSVKNVKAGLVFQIINKIMGFIVKTIFIKELGNEYLGINGLFTNVLTILSFAELGIGTTIIYSMYKPVALNDTNKIKSLMKLYKDIYRKIGLLILIIGIIFIPFLNILLKNRVTIGNNLIIIYILFLTETVSSYFFTYKKSIIFAHQKQRIIDNIDSITYFVRSILEILFLITTKNYILYLIIKIIIVLIENIYISNKANKMYPYLKDYNIDKLDINEKKDIFRNIKYLIIYRLGFLAICSTDNIIISFIINVTTVGILSNYVLITDSIRSILYSLINSITGSIGNLNATESIEKQEDMFFNITYIYYIIYSICCILFIVIVNSFIKIWLGSSYLFDMYVVLLLGINIFIEGIKTPSYIFRTTLGIFDKCKIIPFIGALSNILLSIILGKLIGIKGIFLATSISMILSYSWIDIYVIYKYSFKLSMREYIIKYIKYYIVFIINILLVFICINIINISNSIIDIIVKIIISIIITILLDIVMFRKYNEKKFLIDKIIILINKNI